MSINKKNSIRVDRKKNRVRRKIARINQSNRLRISVFRSISHIYVQVIDDIAQKTLAACSSLELKQISGTKKEVAFQIGKELAKRLLSVDQKHSDNVVFDRGQYKYHGRVAEVAAGLRDGGLNF